MSYSCKTHHNPNIWGWFCDAHNRIAETKHYCVQGLLERIAELEAPIRVVIEVEGGVVTEVRAARPEAITAILLDHDAEEESVLAVEELGILADDPYPIVDDAEGWPEPPETW